MGFIIDIVKLLTVLKDMKRAEVDKINAETARDKQRAEQKWKEEKRKAEKRQAKRKRSGKIKQGRYCISTALKNNMLLDVAGGNTHAIHNGTNVQIYSANGTDAQDFTIQHVQGEWYVIKHTASGKVLDVQGKSPRSGTNVFVWEYLDADNQLWSFIPKNGGYMIQSKLGTYLDVCGAGTKDGTNVWAYEKMNNDAQLWYLIRVR